jgi:hypothetical protein
LEHKDMIKRSSLGCRQAQCPRKLQGGNADMYSSGSAITSYRAVNRPQTACR